MILLEVVEEANKTNNRFHLTSQKHSETGQSGQKVEFDLSLIVNESKEDQLGGGIKVALANLGGNSKELTSSQNTHRIKFEVFISEK